MTLRGRLTAAFLAVVLGPVLLGALFVASTMNAVDRGRSTERLAVAAATVRTSVDALCQQLRAAADAVALAGPDAAGAAGQVVSRGLAAAVVVRDTADQTTYATPGGPPPPWRECADAAPAGGPVGALTARVDLRDRAGTTLGTVTTAQPIDPAFVARLAAVTGVAVTLLDDGTGPARVTHTTESLEVRDAVLAAAGALDGERVRKTEDGRFVRRIGPSSGQPLPLVLSVPSEQPPGLDTALVVAVLLAALLAVLAAWRLARVTTRPLVELATAVDRVAHGDLSARVPVRTRDEVGRLADAFNRMTRETGSYVAALTSSRDQLRGHLAVLGDTLASTHDLQRILRVILHSAIAATGARAGAVLLVDSGDMLVAQCAEGLDGRWPDGEAPATLRVPVGSGVLGAVAATGEPRCGRMEPADVPPGEPGCRTYVAVPFAAPTGPGLSSPAAGGPATDDAPTAELPSGVGFALAAEGGGAVTTLGVLALYDRLGADEFDEDDLVTLRTFAGHAAVAVDNVRVHEEAQRLSLTDPLTGLWNYRYLRESIRREVERASRFRRMLSVLALDLDRFKDVNDTYGHAAGDTVLAEFARRVRGEIREVDLAFRQGGEEFVLLLPETDARGAAIVAERLGAAIRDTSVPVETHSGATVPVRVTVSIGIAVYPDHASTGQQVLEAADDALYAAKAAGRDTYRVSPSRQLAAIELPVPAGAVSPPDGLPRAGRAAAPTRLASACAADAASPVEAAHAEAEPAGEPLGPALTGPDVARAGPGSPRSSPAGGASSGPHPPRQSRGR
ncbi:diguanylate cyclase [Micromonospora krabiensis]|uniref:Diguanylate cyclase (GGDEF) domain-containing protein n=1 Tax=Micromonospora krabiensis TaxID=307121 RepID=A0A1C3N6F4_9ACTN|nr:diguanylate cyclase [Micromonospora krabiensis]SBV28158.1 diguanylate cyclase (GGDEF) domain-containing protein [Micromonospora krabiensis]